MYIQWDGSSDNVNYTNIFFLVWLLVSAERAGWPLRQVYLLRFVVGHTHNRLDSMFAQLSKALYGNHSRGASRRDVLSFSEFKTLCEKVYCRVLSHFEDITALTLTLDMYTYTHPPLISLLHTRRCMTWTSSSRRCVRRTRLATSRLPLRFI